MDGSVPDAEPTAWRQALGDGRVAWGLTALLLLVGLGLHAGVGAAWLSLDQDPAAGVCCDNTGFILTRIRILEQAAARGEPTPGWTHQVRMATEMGLAAWRLWPDNSDSLQRAVLGGSLLSQVLLFLGVGRLRGPWFGLLAAALLPLLPVVAFMERRWDGTSNSLALLPLAFLLLTASRSLAVVPLAAALGGLVAVMMAWTTMFSDDLMLVFATGAMVVGALLRGLTTGRGPQGEPVRRVAVLVGAVALVSVALLGIFWGFELPVSKELERYGGELATDTGGPVVGAWSQTPRLAYLGHLYWRGLTPWLAIPCLVALPLALRRPGGRAELTAWLLLPTLFLAAISKRNFYYLYPIYTALPVLLALGVAGLPRWGLLRPVVGLGLVLLGGVQVGARSFPNSSLGRALSEVRWLRGDDNFGGLFQTVDHGLRLYPRTGTPHEALAEAVHTALPEVSCACEVGLLYERLEASTLWELAVRRPCLQQLNGAAADGSEVGAMVLLGELAPGDLQRRRGPAPPATEGFVPHELPDPGLTLWLRPEGWWAETCPTSD